MEVIQSVHNPKVKNWLKLKTKKGRSSEKAYLIEGIHLLDEAIKGNAEIECVIIQEDSVLKCRSILSALDTPIFTVSEQVMAKLTDTQNPQGVCAIVKMESHFLHDLVKGDSFILVLDALQDPGNVGTIIRTADAAGVTGIVLGKGTVDVYNPKVVRSTMGSLFHLPVIEVDLEEALNLLAEEGVLLVATSLQGLVSYDEPLYKGPVALIIGNEANGVSEQSLTRCDVKVKIPIYGKAESLNAAIATGILLFEAARQRK